MVAELPLAVAELAAFQEGVITRAQAAGLGLTEGALRARIRAGYWLPLGRGVYRTFTGEAHRRSVLWAAVLQAGHGAVLSHPSAAEIDRLTDVPSSPVHVAVSLRRRVERIPGVVVHYSSRVEEARHPCLQPPRTRIEETVLDLAHSAAAFDEAASWLCRAVGGRFTTAERLGAAIAARQRLRRRVALLAALDEIGDGVHSLLELRYAKIERAHELPRAQRQARFSRGRRTLYRDNLAQEYALAVELDGRAAHPAERRWRDMRRDNAGLAEGVVTLRYGWADVTERPCQVAAQVGQALRIRGWPGRPRRCGPGCTSAP
jgi:predicted transcriptional regulator of viral defense system/very-short-patch-repair endonuclease